MYNIDEIRDTIICGNTLDELKQFPNECIDTVCCSPPYWGLRSYSTNGQVWDGDSDCAHEWVNNTQTKEVFDKSGSVWLTGHWKDTAEVVTRKEHPEYWTNIKVKTGYCQRCNAWRGELGLEPTFQLYIEHLQTIFDEVYRVLKKTGTCWVDMGDTYSNANNDTAPTKSLCNIPFRFAISMTDHNWIQRNTIIWHKPSCMPSSAKDRFTVDFEYVFLFSKNKKYYFEQQFEAYADITLTETRYNGQATKDYKSAMAQNPSETKRRVINSIDTNRGRNKRTVWRINPQSFKDAHFAVFPEKLVEPMIKAGCPMEICDSCDKAFKQIPIRDKLPRIKTKFTEYIGDTLGGSNTIGHGEAKDGCGVHHGNYTDKCDCDAPTHAGIVLDPFVGSGTTALVARKLGRHYIGIDLQPDYVKMSEKRLAEML